MGTETTMREHAGAGRDHVSLTGSASIRSMAAGGVTHRSDPPLTLQTVDPAILSNWDQPQPQLPQRSPRFVPGGPAEPPFPPPTNNDQVLTSIRIDTSVGIAAGVGAAAAEGGPADLILRQSRFETLEARVAVLEAALASRLAGVGHNRGPYLDDNLSVDEAGVQNLIALLKEQRATAPVGLSKLTQAARVADPTINKWRERIDTFVKGVLFGAGKRAGEEITKQLDHAAWVHSVYSALQAVFEALTSWLQLF
jgi:hypothetical protein